MKTFFIKVGKSWQVIKRDGVINGCQCNDDCKISFSGTKMRGLLQDKKEISDKFMRPEIVEYLNNQDDIFCA